VPSEGYTKSDRFSKFGGIGVRRLCAIAMANQAIDQTEDPRVVLMALAIAHSQSGEIDLIMAWRDCRLSKMRCCRSFA
jgi:hypothetical protein